MILFRWESLISHTLHLGLTCTYTKWLSDWSACENNGIFYGEIVMYALVNISHLDVTFVIVLYSQTTFCFPFLSLCFVYECFFIVSRFVQKENSEKSRGLTFIQYIPVQHRMWQCASILLSDKLKKCVYYRIIILSELWNSLKEWTIQKKRKLPSLQCDNMHQFSRATWMNWAAVLWLFGYSQVWKQPHWPKVSQSESRFGMVQVNCPFDGISFFLFL